MVFPRKSFIPALLEKKSKPPDSALSLPVSPTTRGGRFVQVTRPRATHWESGPAPVFVAPLMMVCPVAPRGNNSVELRRGLVALPAMPRHTGLFLRKAIASRTLNVRELGLLFQKGNERFERVPLGALEVVVRNRSPRGSRILEHFAESTRQPLIGRAGQLWVRPLVLRRD